MKPETLWILVTVALVVVFGILAFSTGSSVWWSVFGIAVSGFGLYWWVVRPYRQSRS